MTEPSAPSSPATELAHERTRQATDRTLLAWIRTALSLIGFGFTIAKSHEVLASAGLLRAPYSLHSVRVFGASFVALGVLCLAGAGAQHVLVARAIRGPRYRYHGARPLAAVVTVVLLAIGLYALAAIASAR